MLDAMPDVRISDITRKAIEELFEGRSDRAYARLCIEEDVADLCRYWQQYLGVVTEFTITATEDGFRVVMVPLKNFDSDSFTSRPEIFNKDVDLPPQVRSPELPLTPKVGVAEDVLDLSLDAWDDEDI